MSDHPLKDAAHWAQDAASQPPPEWEALTGIPLYMDQVVLYLTEQLAFLQREGGPPLLTSSMVNNYVKSGAVPRPEKKKYSRPHLGALAVLCMLKQVLSLQDIKTLLAGSGTAQGFYGLCREAHRAAMEELQARLAKSAQQGADPRQEALRLAAEANVKRAAAERILAQLAQGQEEKKAES